MLPVHSFECVVCAAAVSPRLHGRLELPRRPDIRTPRRHAADRAATAIAVKPSKLGGIQAALDVLDQVHAAGMHATIGGMLESGLGRHVLAALAPLPAFTLVGDLSPAGRWLADDPFPDITMRSGMIAAPSRLGIAGEPFANRLERYTVRRATVTAATALAAVTNR